MALGGRAAAGEVAQSHLSSSLSSARWMDLPALSETWRQEAARLAALLTFSMMPASERRLIRADRARALLLEAYFLYLEQLDVTDLGRG